MIVHMAGSLKAEGMSQEFKANLNSNNWKM